ncbi:facilitated trehalose transporter Tret1-like [Pollicipes pollicipes]|uniref:facilitated trehalose transporter Tret1-like n=1 Tax=Pollicipes pollicipes TaxID=41117 RepID=UPI0018850611|nr:facilitated trehalose transporter Tret1-like [Pollicipes pollicipes]
MTSSTLELIYSPKSSSYITQVLATLAVSMGPLAVGLGKGYSSPALASLAGPASLGGLAISPEEGSWVASLSLLGALVGGLPAGLALRLGRRRTPSFLLFRGREREAQVALQWLRGARADVAAEHAVLRANILQIRPGRPRALLRPLLVTCGLMLLQKFSGVNAFSFYAVPILSKTFARTSAHGAAVVVCLLQILAGLTSGVLIDTVGRLPLLAVSSALMSLALAGFGTFVYVVDASQLLTDGQQAPLDWIPMSCVLVFQVAFSLGVGPISWLLIGELFPLRHRGLGAFATSVSYGCAFVSVKTFVDLERALGLHGVFWLYAAVSALCLVFVLAWVPETRGKELPEMERTGC